MGDTRRRSKGFIGPLKKAWPRNPWVLPGCRGLCLIHRVRPEWMFRGNREETNWPRSITSSSWRPSSWSPSWPSWPSSSQPCSTPLSFVRVRTTVVAPQNVINMNYLLFEMQLCRAFEKDPQIADCKKPAIYKG